VLKLFTETPAILLHNTWFGSRNIFLKGCEQSIGE